MDGGNAATATILIARAVTLVPIELHRIPQRAGKTLGPRLP